MEAWRESARPATQQAGRHKVAQALFTPSPRGAACVVFAISACSIAQPRSTKPHSQEWLCHLGNARALLAKAGGLFEGVGQLQDTEIRLVAADDLDADGEAFRREAAGDRGSRIAGGRDVPAGFHPVDVAGEF